MKYNIDIKENMKDNVISKINKSRVNEGINDLVKEYYFDEHHSESILDLYSYYDA